MTAAAPRRRLAVLGSLLLASLATVAGPLEPTSAAATPTTSVTPSDTPSTDPSVGGTAPADPGSAGAEPDEDAEQQAEAAQTPLNVVIDRLTPSTLPDRDEQVVVSGRVTNVDESTWSDLKVYLLTSASPMTTQEELDAAVASDPAIEIGDRLIDPGQFQVVPDLEPGDSTRFRLEVPGRELLVSREPGVYWLAVHVLGTDESGRLEGADGRARTFLPFVPDQSPGTQLALGVQFRRHVVRAADGRLEYDALWAKQLRSGRLDRLLSLSSSADRGRTSWPLTWLVDGAVLDAAQSLVAGDPPVDLVSEGAEVTGPAEGSDEEEAAAEAASDAPVSRAAARWVERFTRAAGETTVLALPYGDLDVSAATATDESELLEIAFTQAQGALDEVLDVAAAPVVAPPDGYLSPDAARALDPDVRVVVGEQALAGDDAGVLAAPRGGSVTTSPAPEELFGPAPGPVNSALAVRQRLLADAALHALSPDRGTTLTVLLPPNWEPGKAWRQARFFDGLDAPWLTGVSLAGLLDPSAIGSDVARGDDLVYPDEAAEAEVPAYAVAATRQLIDSNKTLQDLLSDGSATSDRIDRQALLTSSYWSRPFPGVATDRARGAALRVGDWLARVTIRGPSFVTMSSERGSIQVTLVNGLDQPVTAGLSADAGGAPLTLTTPDPVELPPGGRQAMDIDADVLDIGVHQVTLQPVTDTGRPVGEVATLSVRSSKVGMILWLIMAGGAITLFGAITVRTVRRLRAAHRRRKAVA